MHLMMMFSALILAWGTRLAFASWRERDKHYWQRSLFFFLFPPLLLLTTALAVLSMGPQGQMLGFKASWFSYLLALGLISYASVLLIKLTYQGWIACRQVSSYPQELVSGKMVRILEIAFPYSALVGFWRSELIISRGLIEILEQEHLDAVLAHEEAHDHHHDTFWFFWLGWLRSCTTWLPHTEELWQELLLLRELRADQQASLKVDSLLLAESLYTVAKKVSQSTSFNFPETLAAAFSDARNRQRLVERIDALLSESECTSQPWWAWHWVLLTFIPLVTLPFHLPIGL